MNPLDDELKSALRPREPSPGFARRLLARIEAESKDRTSLSRRLAALGGIFRLPRVRWAAAAFACLAIMTGVVQYRRYQRTRAEGEMARAQVMLALEIASDKLNVALAPVQQVERRQTPAGTKKKSGSKRNPQDDPRR